MEKVINFMKQRYKIFIPVMVVFVLLITMYFLYREYKYDNYRNKEEVAVYQYFGGMKNEYTAIVTSNLKGVIVDVNAKDKKIEYSSVPIYYKDKDIVLFPSEMSIVFPIKNASQYRLYKYSMYEKIDDTHMITNGMDKGDFYYFFLFDGKGLYFFPDEVTLNIDGKEYTKLSSMSYLSYVGGYTIKYYDKASDKSELLEIEGKKITVSSEKININVNESYFMVYNDKNLLIKPYNLDALSIDKE